MKHSVNLSEQNALKKIIGLRVLTIGAYVLVFVVGIMVRMLAPPVPIDPMMMNHTHLG
jgi:multisubunit Na+/H+ antiporter MnhC subunit